MKNQKIAFLLSLSWLIGLVAVFSFPPEIKIKSDGFTHQSELREITAPELVLRTSGQSPEVPAFKADLHFSDLLGSYSDIDFVPCLAQYLSPSFFTKSKALFNVLITFFYFFYTW